jgi:hypothetical protein
MPMDLTWLTEALVRDVLPILGTAIATLLVGVLTRFLKQQKIEITAAQEERLRELVRDAVKAVEEQSRRQPMTSPQKAVAAAQIVLDQAPHEIPPDKLRVAIDAALPDMREQLDQR